MVVGIYYLEKRCDIQMESDVRSETLENTLYEHMIFSGQCYVCAP